MSKWTINAFIEWFDFAEGWTSVAVDCVSVITVLCRIHYSIPTNRYTLLSIKDKMLSAIATPLIELVFLQSITGYALRWCIADCGSYTPCNTETISGDISESCWAVAWKSIIRKNEPIFAKHASIICRNLVAVSNVSASSSNWLWSNTYAFICGCIKN